MRRFKWNLTACVVFLFFFLCLSTFAYSAESKFEVQFGAFAIEANAKALVRELTGFDDSIHISKLTNQAGKSFFTVRSGAFATVREARSYKDSFNVGHSDIDPVILVRDSLEPVPPDADSHEKKVTAEAAKTAENPMVSEEPADENPIEPEEPAEKEPADDTPIISEEPADDLWGDAGPGTEEEQTDLPEPETTYDPKGLTALEQEIEKLQAQVKTLLDAEDIRSELTESAEEKSRKEEDILNAAGRNYTLMQKGKIGIEYKLAYTYYAFDTIKELNIIEHKSNHNITNTFTLEYPLKDNLTLEAAIPFVYEYDNVGRDDSKSVTDFGDVSFGASFQPIKSGGKIPSMIFNTTLTCPMGRNPYEVNPSTELSTGSGGYSLEGSVSMSKAVDPIMAYGTLSYAYKHPIKNLDYKIGSYTLGKYERGDRIGLSLGLGYALSYKTSLSLGYSYSYTFESKRYYKEANPVSYPTQTASSISIGTSWRLNPKLRLNMSLGIGLSNSDYFTLSFRFPFEFAL
ncbi:MAG: hypothetical protein GY737_23975 [Desulfobacteraceae bacterium]|nr:hypothetical protein [Desulfobacteraceae bacterium]